MLIRSERKEKRKINIIRKEQKDLKCRDVAFEFVGAVALADLSISSPSIRARMHLSHHVGLIRRWSSVCGPLHSRQHCVFVASVRCVVQFPAFSAFRLV